MRRVQVVPFFVIWLGVNEENALRRTVGQGEAIGSSPPVCVLFCLLSTTIQGWVEHMLMNSWYVQL